MLIYLSNRKIIGGEPCAKYPTKKIANWSILLDKPNGLLYYKQA